MEKDLQTLKQVHVYKYIYICIIIYIPTISYFFSDLETLQGQAKTKAAVASTHGLQLDNAQQLHAFLQEHHSEVSSEQHERLHEVLTYVIDLFWK